MSSSPSPRVPEPSGRRFRLPVLAYLTVLFLFFCVAPLAFSAHAGEPSSGVAVGPQTVLLIVPALAAVFIARTATFVDDRGIRVRAAFGRRDLPWNAIRGLSVTGRSVFAVVDDGAVRLPCVRVSDLASISRVSAGRLPEVAEAPIKVPPSRRRRR